MKRLLILSLSVVVLGGAPKVFAQATYDPPTAQRPPPNVLLVLDATVGQNGLVQAREFAAVAGVNGIVLTKLDGTAKGGVAVAIRQQMGIPVKYIGVGEGIDDLQVFNPDSYVDALFA